MGGLSCCRALPQTEALAWGSVSTRTTFSRPCPAATAICTAKVVLPDPPFCERKAIARIGLLGMLECEYARMRALTHAYYSAAASAVNSVFGESQIFETPSFSCFCGCAVVLRITGTRSP